MFSTLTASMSSEWSLGCMEPIMEALSLCVPAGVTTSATFKRCRRVYSAFTLLMIVIDNVPYLKGASMIGGLLFTSLASANFGVNIKVSTTPFDHA